VAFRIECHEIKVHNLLEWESTSSGNVKWRQECRYSWNLEHFFSCTNWPQGLSR